MTATTQSHGWLPSIDGGLTDPVASIDDVTFGELYNLLDGDISELLETYLVEAPRLIQDALMAATKGDCAIVQNCAHSLKSSSANVGALRLAMLARTLEEAAGSTEQCNGLDDSIKALIAEFENVETLLRMRL